MAFTTLGNKCTMYTMELSTWIKQNLYIEAKRKDFWDGCALIWLRQCPNLHEAAGKLRQYDGGEGVVVCETKLGLESNAHVQGFLRLIKWKAADPERRSIFLYVPMGTHTGNYIHYRGFISVVIGTDLGYPKHMNNYSGGNSEKKS
ncbi:MAG: hypothetical protein AB7T49_16175 [Oligoflexales bacterium]